MKYKNKNKHKHTQKRNNNFLPWPIQTVEIESEYVVTNLYQLTTIKSG